MLRLVNTHRMAPVKDIDRKCLKPLNYSIPRVLPFFNVFRLTTYPNIRDDESHTEELGAVEFLVIFVFTNKINTKRVSHSFTKVV